ncbi:type IV toxin-antitoxin system AbiEi family antitoxin domain-containing protein [Tomitella biformata]|uniref:type IV toxin-antitoxin system AbiEi family antitoxin domain-containing protein n=1 Tax=Tomitella biformata TaxID=630403 RepID=UPI0004657321|nr:type IV toxin-antitoxin system AbiEi family antitoxin domain-containing protein [Tomitella biformata]
MVSDSPADSVVGLASEQWGLVTSRQARAAASVTPQQLKRMADAGYLERLHHGIYRLARFPHDEHQNERVAWLALDPARVMWERLDEDVPTGVLSHRTAAHLHQLGDLDADVVEITALRRHRLSIPDVAIYRGPLARDNWQVIDGLPVTTPVRTIADLAAAGTDSGHLAAVVRDTLARDLATIEDTTAALAPHAFAYGHRALDGPGFLDSLIQEAGVPATTLALADITRRLSAAVSPVRPDLLRAISADLAAQHFEELTAELARLASPTMDDIADSASATGALTQALSSATGLKEIARVLRELPQPNSLNTFLAAARTDPAGLEALLNAAPLSKGHQQ